MYRLACLGAESYDVQLAYILRRTNSMSDCGNLMYLHLQHDYEQAHLDT